jgi:hypothetical protein
MSRAAAGVAAWPSSASAADLDDRVVALAQGNYVAGLERLLGGLGVVVARPAGRRCSVVVRGVAHGQGICF